MKRVRCLVPAREHCVVRTTDGARRNKRLPDELAATACVDALGYLEDTEQLGHGEKILKALAEVAEHNPAALPLEIDAYTRCKSPAGRLLSMYGTSSVVAEPLSRHPAVEQGANGHP